MRLAWMFLTCLLCFGCSEDRPTAPHSTGDSPVVVQRFDIAPPRNPGATVDLALSFYVATNIEVTRTELVAAGTGEDVLPSPWGSLYKINGEILEEGRRVDQPTSWVLKLRFHNDSNIVCTSCEVVSVEYRLFD